MLIVQRVWNNLFMPGEPGYESLMSLSQWTPGSHTITKAHITIIYNQPLVPSSPLHHMCMNHSCPCHNGLLVVTRQQKAHITITYNQPLVPSSPFHHMCMNHSCPYHSGLQVVSYIPPSWPYFTHYPYPYSPRCPFYYLLNTP